MALTPGTRLGPYEILSALGAGGMGEVYKARDSRLTRTVAIKVLPAHTAADAAARARFEREARAIAALSHPHICVVYDVGHQDGIDYLVMELLEGETLAERLARAKGPLPLDEVLKIGVAIADALDKAHRAGIVHRDLKPLNVMLTKAGPKLLDFGLAKLHGGASPVALSGETDATTAGPGTAKGTILGTIHYMSPEQVEGRQADTRSDIWALGALLYEMATGQRPFDGESAASIIGAILKDRPLPLSAGRAEVPAQLDHVVARCLEKDPDERWQSVGDVRRELQFSAVSEPIPVSAKHSSGAPGQWRWRPSPTAATLLGFSLLLVGIVVGGVGTARFQQPVSLEPIWLSIAPPGRPFGFRTSPVVSPDGTQVAFWAQDSDGTSRLWVKPVHSPGARSLPGTSGTEDSGSGRPMAWSPDSRSLVFLANLKLSRIELAGGPPQRLADAGASPRGVAWGADGVILYVPSSSGSGLYKIPATGGTPEPVKVGHAPQAAEWPAFLPDGRHFLFHVTSLIADPSEVGVYAGSLDSADATPILSVNSRAEYASGYLYFVRDGALFAQAFDAVSLAMSGEPFRIADGIGRGGGDQPAYAFSASPAGVIAFSDAPSLPASQLTWVDRSGSVVRRLGDPGRFFGFAMSADERQIVVEEPSGARSSTASLWLADRMTGVLTLFTNDGRSPLWDPKGERLLYQTRGTRLAERGLGAGREDEIPIADGGPRPWPEDESRDGRFILVRLDAQDTQGDIWTLERGKPQTALPYLRTRANETQARFSPDGRWVAYTSDESGQEEVYVQSFPTLGHKIRVSTAGGFRPLWRPDGSELYFLSGANAFMVSAVTRTADRLETSAPKVMFTTEGLGSSASSYRQQTAVSATGDRFLLNLLVPEPTLTSMSIVLNWDPRVAR